MTTYNFKTYRGDTFDGVEFQINVNGSPLNLTGATLLMVIKTTANAPTVSATLTETTGLTITNALQGKFVIDEQILPLSAGQYIYDIQITIGTKVKSYIKGSILVEQDVSNV